MVTKIAEISEKGALRSAFESRLGVAGGQARPDRPQYTKAQQGVFFF